MVIQPGRSIRVRTLFLSDVHLGFRCARARARELEEFLHHVEAECIVLAGDIVDTLSMAKRFFWAESHTRVLKALQARRRGGTRLVYLPGNHDSRPDTVADMLQGKVEVHREWVYETSAGARMLVVHGDQFDGHVHCAPWLSWLGSALYDLTVEVNHRVNDVRRRHRRPYWPLAERAKLAIAASSRYIGRYEAAAAAAARARGYDGIICGHIHRANLREIDGTMYANTGDWVESCTALAEDLSGRLAVVRPHAQGARAVRPLAPAVPEAA